MERPQPSRTSRKRHLWLALVALLVTGSIGLAVWPKPKYQGRTLDEWFAAPVLFTNTTSAFHEAGPRGLKMLLREVAGQESAWRLQAARLREWLDTKGWWKQSRPAWLANPWWRANIAYWLLRSYSTVPSELLPLLTNQLMTAADYCDSIGLAGNPRSRTVMEIEALRLQRMGTI